MSQARAAQEAVVRADAARREAKANRRAVFIREHKVKSYREIAVEVGLSKSRVSQIINGRDR